MATDSPDHLTPVDPLAWYGRVWEYLSSELTRNSLTGYLTALSVAVIGCAVIWCVKGFLARYAARRLSGSGGGERVDPRLARRAALSMIPLLYLLPLYSALAILRFSPALTRLISLFFLLFFTTRAVTFLSSLAVLVTDVYLRSRKKSVDSASGKALTPIIRMLFWAVGLTFLLDNLGFQISSIIAGLGIMGVAVGLAGQTILADFFGYLVILLDEPFRIGDLVTVGGRTGTVESIGLKTTRLRTSSGELLICPNADFTKQAIINARGVASRTDVFRFTLHPDTPPDLLARFPDLVREQAARLSGFELTRINLAAMSGNGPEFEAAIRMPQTDFTALMAAREELLLVIAEVAQRSGVRFACPLMTTSTTSGG